MAEKTSTLSWRGETPKTTRNVQTGTFVSRETRGEPMHTSVTRRNIGKFRPVITEFAPDPRLFHEFHAVIAAPDPRLLEAIQRATANLADTARDALLVVAQTARSQEWNRMLRSFIQEYQASEFATVISRVLDAAEDPDPEELHPKQYAVTGIIGLLAGVPAFLLSTFPRGAVAVDEDGALHIYWRNGTKRLELGYPANAPNEPYIYVHEGGTGALHERVSAQDLAEYLDRLTAV